MVHKKRSFRNDKIEIVVRDQSGSRIWKDSGDIDSTLIKFLGKFEGLEGSIKRLGVKMDKRSRKFQDMFK